MPSVTPSEPYNGYYTKHLVELEDELKTDNKRVQERARQDVKDLENRYSESIQKHGERSNEAVEKIRDNMEERHETARKEQREEIEKFRKQNYDRYGRDHSTEAENAQLRLREAVENNEIDRKTFEKRLADSEISSNHKAEELNKAYNDRLTRVTEAEREASSKAINNAQETQKRLQEYEQEEHAKKYETLNSKRMEEQQEHRRRAQALVNDNKRDMDNLSRHLNESTDRRLEKAHQASLDREQTAAKDMQRSNNEQNRGLREQIRSLVGEEGKGAREGAKAKAEVVREYEDEWRTRLAQSSDASQREIKNLQDKMDSADGKTAERATQQAQERETYFAQLIAKQNAENRQERTEIVSQYDKALKEADIRAQKDRKINEDRTEHAVRTAGEQRAEALRVQAENYQQSARTSKQNDQDIIDKLQAELHKRTDPSEESDIPPAVEAAVRRSVVKQYEKSMAAETERHQKDRDSLQRNYSERFAEVRDKGQSALSENDRRRLTESHQKEVVMMDHIQDVVDEKDMAIRNFSQEHDRQTETLNRLYSQAQVKQRNDYEGVLQTTKEDASARIQAVRQESDFAMKSQLRAFSFRENELIRGYEKKLADQKLESDTRLEEVRSQAQQTIRDNLRREKANYEEQGRNYEQRIAQMVDQQKERERSIKQSHEDQLDKVKRSNALLQSKKG